MKKIVYLFTSFLFLSYLAQGQGIHFETGQWSDVLAKAKQENKPIFVDAYTVWCGPCRKMDQEVFTLEDVGQYLNEQFVSYKMDMEKGEGVDFAIKYDVTAFPTLLFFDHNGQMLYKSVGYKDRDQLLATTKLALDPKNHIESFRLAYQNSDQSLYSLILYCKQLREADHYKMAREIAQQRLDRLSKKEKYTIEEWILISGYVRSYEDPLFISFLKKKSKYLPVVDQEDINKYIHQVLGNTALFYNNKQDQGQSLQRYLQIVKGIKKYVNSDYYIARALYFTHLDSSDYVLLPYASGFLDQDFQLDYDEGKTAYYLAFMANRFVDHEDSVFTDAAFRWAIKSVELDPQDYKNKFVLARLYYNQGRADQALPYAEAALAIEKNFLEAGVIKNLFKANEIAPFIEKIKLEAKL